MSAQAAKMSLKARIIEFLLAKLRDVYRPAPPPRSLATPHRCAPPVLSRRSEHLITQKVSCDPR